jgi:hypothetical protein
MSGGRYVQRRVIFCIERRERIGRGSKAVGDVQMKESEEARS